MKKVHVYYQEIYLKQLEKLQIWVVYCFYDTDVNSLS